MKTIDGSLGLVDELAGANRQPSASGNERHNFAVADFFCGIGGFHVAASNLGLRVVYACDIDEHARVAYKHNFDLDPDGDVCDVTPDDVPDHDILCAGFPCQPFSIIGRRQGLSDPRGVVFFELLRFVRAKRPLGVILENVKQLTTIHGGQVIQRIVKDLWNLGYTVDWRVLNAMDFGLPQKRERTIIVATRSQCRFPWPRKSAPMRSLESILEADPDPGYYVTPAIRRKRHAAHTPAVSPAIWHENKGGNVSSHPWSCALRAGASYNYLLVDGERRLTLREQLRLQGFPDSWEIVCNAAQTKNRSATRFLFPSCKPSWKAW